MVRTGNLVVRTTESEWSRNVSASHGSDGDLVFRTMATGNKIMEGFLGFFGGLKAQYGYFLLGTHLFSINTCIMPLLLV